LLFLPEIISGYPPPSPQVSPTSDGVTNEITAG
jgi:hypothetical protein